MQIKTFELDALVSLLFDRKIVCGKPSPPPTQIEFQATNSSWSELMMWARNRSKESATVDDKWRMGNSALATILVDLSYCACAQTQWMNEPRKWIRPQKEPACTGWRSQPNGSRAKWIHLSADYRMIRPDCGRQQRSGRGSIQSKREREKERESKVQS